MYISRSFSSEIKLGVRRFKKLIEVGKIQDSRFSKTWINFTLSILFYQWKTSSKHKSSHQRCSIEKGVLKNFTGKHLCQSIFFNKVTGLRSATLLIRRLWHRYFPMNFVKFLRTRFLQNISERLLLQIKNSIKNFMVVMPSSFYKDNDKT